MPRKKKRKIMSIDELYNFCLKNNFVRFDSAEFGKELMVRMNGNFEKTEEDVNKHTEGLTPFISRAFHDHVNLNKSEIPEESFNENIPSVNFRPILAHITTNSKDELDFGSHDFYIVTDKDGNEKVIYEEQPIGVIDGSQTTIEYDETVKVNRAVLHGYLYDEYCQDAIDILNRRGTVDCSVELCIRSMSFNSDNKTLMLDDFYVSGLTLLSEDAKPGMAGSNFKIEDFAVSTECLNFDTDNKLVETLEKLNVILDSFNINNFSGKEDEVEVANKENFDEVTETTKVTETEKTTEEEVTIIENQTEETVDEPSEDETDSEDTEIKEDNACGGGGSGSKKKKKKNSLEDEPMTRTYELSHDDVRCALYNLLAPYEEEYNDCYWIIDVFDSYFVYQNYNGKFYGQKYSKENDVVAFEGERYELFLEYLTASEKTELNDMRANYETLKAEVNKYENEARQNILNSQEYSVLTGNEEFSHLIENANKYSVDELRDKADAIFGRFSKSNTVASNHTKKLKYTLNDSKKKSPYGSLFNNEK